jgi:hypothetical protein
MKKLRWKEHQLKSKKEGQSCEGSEEEGQSYEGSEEEGQSYEESEEKGEPNEAAGSSEMLVTNYQLTISYLRRL